MSFSRTTAGRYKGYGSPDLYPREKADTATRLGWPEEPNESASATRGELREPAARWRSVWEEPATEKRRTRGTKFCALLRDRWNEENTSTRAEEYSQALADSRGGLQLESDLSLDVGCWKPRELKNRHALVSFLLLWVIRWFPETQESKILHFSIRRPSPQQNCRYLRYRLRHSNERSSATGC